ncbi:hypothetical protein [Pseudanabaena sp. ABRG5-3]|uniref:hypothetical protein n=1 Tax=Pseudanabaena sp. ABRG5-3 TaxID=685565 RepID=UPI000F8222A4|nr:hypothetical protein [Pseudanabaena sp. ABRG5-3]
MVSFTRDTFHNSQILLSDRVLRYSRWSSHAIFGSAIALCLSTFIPSHWTSKLVNVAIAPVLFAVSNRLDRLALYAEGYGSISEAQSHIQYRNWLDASLAPPKREIQNVQPEVVETPNYYDWSNISDEAVGFLICGNSGSAKSSLATWLAGHLSQSNPMAVIALDPHFNDCWKLAGIKSIGKIEQIESALNWLLTELDARCTRKGEGLPLGDHLFVICDELNASLERFKDRKVVESTLRRLGSEGRKFGLTFCGLNQSSNASAIGIDAKYRSNYALILLGQSARTHPQLGKHLADVAYPCVLDGSIAPSLALHPTHGEYKVFKKQGNPPKNLIQINQLPLPSGLLAAIDDRPIAVQMLESGLPPNVATALSTQPQSTAIAPVFQKIINYLDGKDWKKDYEIKASIRDFKDSDAPLTEVQTYLQFLELQGYLETRSTQRGSLEARVIQDKTP